MLSCFTQQNCENETFKKLRKNEVPCAYYYYLKKGRKCAIRWEENSVPGCKAKIVSLTSNCITS